MSLLERERRGRERWGEKKCFYVLINLPFNLCWLELTFVQSNNIPGCSAMPGVFGLPWFLNNCWAGVPSSRNYRWIARSHHMSNSRALTVHSFAHCLVGEFTWYVVDFTQQSYCQYLHHAVKTMVTQQFSLNVVGWLQACVVYSSSLKLILWSPPTCSDQR